MSSDLPKPGFTMTPLMRELCGVRPRPGTKARRPKRRHRLLRCPWCDGVNLHYRTVADDVRRYRCLDCKRKYKRPMSFRVRVV